MAKAGFCSKCKSEVVLTAEGKCQNGHGIEFITNVYETPEVKIQEKKNSLWKTDLLEILRESSVRSRNIAVVLLAIILILVFVIQYVGTLNQLQNTINHSRLSSGHWSILMKTSDYERQNASLILGVEVFSTALCSAGLLWIINMKQTKSNNGHEK